LDKTPQHIAREAASLPDAPGVYKFFDSDNTILYIGKAKNLKKRVQSYFAKSQHNNKTTVMLRKAVRIEHIVVANENDALLLENSLIKQWQPRYNVMLKDDKTYPWVCITNEEFPRIVYTRNKADFIGEFYGPYTSGYTIKTLLSLVKQLYKPRSCRLKLTQENINKAKFDVCLEYHIGTCLAPCVGFQSKDDYRANIEEARSIIKGRMLHVIGYLQQKMMSLAKEYKYEEANQIKEKIAIIESFKAKSTVVNNKAKNIDVYGIAHDNHSYYISYLKIIDGAIVHSFNTEVKRRMNETPEEVLLHVAFDIWNRNRKDTNEAVVPVKPDFTPEGLKWKVPTKGDKLKLQELAQRNARFFMMEKQRILEKRDPEIAIERKLQTLKKDLRLAEMPYYIECFDNSNLQGTNPVASCVVFRNTRPSKKEYRHYNIKTVSGANDFASMSEIIFRRYKRLSEEGGELPKLIVIDGGKGQLSAAVDSLKTLDLYGKMAIIGLAKRLEEIYYPGDSTPMYLDKNSESLKIIRQLRDEAHRFAITFHRKKRDKQMLDNELLHIKGIGEKTLGLLLKHFGSAHNIKHAPVDELSKIIGKSKALIIQDHFKKQ